MNKKELKKKFMKLDKIIKDEKMNKKILDLKIKKEKEMKQNELRKNKKKKLTDVLGISPQVTDSSKFNQSNTSDKKNELGLFSRLFKKNSKKKEDSLPEDSILKIS